MRHVLGFRRKQLTPSNSTSPILHPFCPSKFYIHIVYRDHRSTQEKLKKTRVMQHLGWQSSCITGETGKMVNKRQNLSWNPVNTDTEGAIESVCINSVSVFSRLNWEKMCGPRTGKTVHNIGVRKLTINEWGWVSYEELWRSRRVLSVEAIGVLLFIQNNW